MEGNKSSADLLGGEPHECHFRSVQKALPQPQDSKTGVLSSGSGSGGTWAPQWGIAPSPFWPQCGVGGADGELLNWDGTSIRRKLIPDQRPPLHLSLSRQLSSVSEELKGCDWPSNELGKVCTTGLCSGTGRRMGTGSPRLPRRACWTSETEYEGDLGIGLYRWSEKTPASPQGPW